MELEEEGVEGGDVFCECGPAPGESGSLDQVNDDVRGEEDGVVEGVSYAGEDVAHLAVAVERCGGGESVPDSLDDFLDDIEVELGMFAGVGEFGRCHGGMIRGAGEKWNSLAGTKGNVEDLRLEAEKRVLSAED